VDGCFAQCEAALESLSDSFTLRLWLYSMVASAVVERSRAKGDLTSSGTSDEDRMNDAGV
jgi:hypothetical protein